ncbi:MAG: TetR/AcrR family transcriptional regulator [Elusimicrobia bacterium]|nr:TetR/AcrR family transcriptional regulator [Elusimicrobiota bacterium]
MARPRTESAEARRRRILNAARALLIRKDYEDVVLDDVARRADVAKGTLYLYFRSKEDLISEVLCDMVGELEAQLRRAGESDPLKELRTIARLHLEFLDENHDFMTQVLRQDPVLTRTRAAPGATGSQGPRGKAVLLSRAALPLQASFHKHLNLLSRRIRRAVKAGLLRPHDPRLGALHFMSIIRMQLVWKVHSGSKRPLREKADEVLGLFLRGVGA